MLPSLLSLSSLSIEETTETTETAAGPAYGCCEEDEDVGVLMQHGLYQMSRLQGSKGDDTSTTYEDLVQKQLEEMKNKFKEMTTKQKQSNFLEKVTTGYDARIQRYTKERDTLHAQVYEKWQKIPESERMKKESVKKSEIEDAINELAKDVSSQRSTEQKTTARRTLNPELASKVKKLTELEKTKKAEEEKTKQKATDLLRAAQEEMRLKQQRRAAVDPDRNGPDEGYEDKAPGERVNRGQNPKAGTGTTEGMQGLAAEIATTEQKKELREAIKELNQAIDYGIPLKEFRDIKDTAEQKALAAANEPWVNNDTMSPQWREVNAALAAKKIFAKVVEDMTKQHEILKKVPDAADFKRMYLDPTVKVIDDMIALPGAWDLKAYAGTLISNTLFRTLSSVELNRNALLLGPAGIGKTSGAELVGRLLHSLGLVHYPFAKELNIVSASDLVGSYSGETPKKVLNFILDHTEKVAVLDEVYQLATLGPFGVEAINQLVYAMSTYVGAHTIFATGYTDDVEKMLQKNEGFSRRWSTRINFSPYSNDELVQIINYQLRKLLGGRKSNDLVLDASATRGLLWIIKYCGGRRGEPGSDAYEKPRDEDPWLYGLIEDWADSMRKLAEAIVDAGYERNEEDVLNKRATFLTKPNDQVTITNLVDGIVRYAYGSGKALLRMQARRLYEGKLRESPVSLQRMENIEDIPTYDKDKTYKQTLPLVDMISQMLAYPNAGEDPKIAYGFLESSQEQSVNEEQGEKRPAESPPHGPGKRTKKATARVIAAQEQEAEQAAERAKKAAGGSQGVEAMDTTPTDTDNKWKRTTVYKLGQRAIDLNNGEYNQVNQAYFSRQKSKRLVNLRVVLGHELNQGASNVRAGDTRGSVYSGSEAVQQLEVEA